MTDTTSTMARSAKIFLSGTFLSRFTGMLRDMSMAFSFGAHPTIAAFMVAFRFSHLFRRLFGETALASSFVPHFETARAAGEEKGNKLFRDLSVLLLVFLSGIVLISEVGLFCLMKWGGVSVETQEILKLSMYMLPGVLFICLFALNASIFQCNKKYFLSSAAPAVFNVVWIGAILFLHRAGPKDAMIWLSIVVTGAFFIQWLISVPGTIAFLKTSGRPEFSPEIKLIIRSFLLTIVGIGAVQINSALDSVFARAASLEGPAYLWYAIRIDQLPLALFALALSAALLPPLSRAIQANDTIKYKELLSFAMRKGFALMFPCTIAVLVVGVSSVNLLYGRGDFTPNAISNTVLCLWGYVFSLVPTCFVFLFAPAFYARKEYFLPTVASVISVVCNTALNAIFVFAFHWGAFSIAIATSIAAVVNCLFLAHFLSKKVGALFPREVLISFAKTVICALVSGGATLFLGHYLIQDASLSLFLGKVASYPSTLFMQSLHFFVLAGAFTIFFLSYAWLLNLDDVLNLVGLKETQNAKQKTQN